MNRKISDNKVFKAKLDRVFAIKKDHAIRRCGQRCEQRYKDYKRQVRDRDAEPVLAETWSRRWYRFMEPSGRQVYGLWSDRREIFFTFLTEEMFENRLRYESGELNAYRPGAHRQPQAQAVA